MQQKMKGKETMGHIFQSKRGAKTRYELMIAMALLHKKKKKKTAVTFSVVATLHYGVHSYYFQVFLRFLVG